MNDKLVAIANGQLVTDSRKVAEHFGKDHNHVMRDIKKLLEGVSKIDRPHVLRNNICQ